MSCSFPAVKAPSEQISPVEEAPPGVTHVQHREVIITNKVRVIEDRGPPRPAEVPPDNVDGEVRITRHYFTGSPLDRGNEQGKWPKISLENKEFGFFFFFFFFFFIGKPHHKYSVLPRVNEREKIVNCKYTDSKGKGYFDICREHFQLINCAKSVLCML